MVRLLLTDRLGQFSLSLLFQSHNGAIAAGEKNETKREEVIVSIPQWCDCC